MTAHKHAALMLQYAQDAMETDKPWERWEYSDTSTLNQHGEKIRDDWYDCGENPGWHPNVQYRRKPEIIKVGRHEFPKPITERPKEGTMYWTIESGGKNGFYAERYKWRQNREDELVIRQGLAHLTEEAAQAHADVLNAICMGDIE